MKPEEQSFALEIAKEIQTTDTWDYSDKKQTWRASSGSDGVRLRMNAFETLKRHKLIEGRSKWSDIYDLTPAGEDFIEAGGFAGLLKRKEEAKESQRLEDEANKTSIEHTPKQTIANNKIVIYTFGLLFIAVISFLAKVQCNKQTTPKREHTLKAKQYAEPQQSSSVKPKIQ